MMQNVFIGILAALIVFSQVMIGTFGPGSVGQGPKTPRIYWVTDPNPARKEQVTLFHQWLKNRGYPDIDLRLDVNNVGMQKIVLQGVTGIAGDLIDTGNSQSFYLDNIGILQSVNDLEARFGYPDSERYPEVLPDMTNAKGQIIFPCNVATSGAMVNLDAFSRHGLPAPDLAMGFDAYEQLGVDFVARANRGLPRQEYYFTGSADLDGMRRSLGISYFNETLSGSAIAQPGSMEVFKRWRHWMHTLHLIPSPAEISLMTMEQGYGNVLLQQIFKGYIATVNVGRYAFIQMRAMKGSPRWSAMMVPYGRRPVATIGTRAAVLYAGSKQKEAAIYFLGFLRSEEYNLHIVHDSDSLPPNPKYLDHPDFLRPLKYTNEWPAHAAFASIAKEFAMPRENSPYAMFQKIVMAEGKANDLFRNQIIDAHEAVALIERATQEEIERFVATHPDIRPRYRTALARQGEIDRLKVEGKKIPLDLVDNPFLHRWYEIAGEGV